MKDGKFQAGVIGLRMGNGHCIGYRDNPHCEVAAVCDTNPVLLEQRKKEYDYVIMDTPPLGVVADTLLVLA